MDAETALHQAVAALAARMAWAQVRARRQAMSDDPEADGWGLCAAENGLSEGEYEAELAYAATDKMERALALLDEEALAALVAVVGT